YDDVSRSGLELGWLRLFILRLDGRPAAALHGYQYGGVFSFYQAGFDPAFAKQSVGLVTMALAIKSAIEEGADEYDLLHGAEPLLNFDGMHVRARRFARQMQYVSRRYRVVALDRLLEPGHAPTPDRPCAVLTIDDGYRNIYRVAFPILKRLRLPATLFVPTG